MKVHPAFRAFTNKQAQSWSSQTGRRVTEVQVTEALAKAFEKQGALQVSIIVPPKPAPGGRRLENPFWGF